MKRIQVVPSTDLSFSSIRLFRCSAESEINFVGARESSPSFGEMSRYMPSRLLKSESVSFYKKQESQ